jgi:hypothetical protein
MAGRIRSIKPEILEDDKTSNLSDTAFRIFVSIICLADDYGNLRANEGWLRGVIFWAKDPTLPFSQALAELSTAPDALITLYKVRGQRYAHINGWSKNQRVDKKGPPRVPGPENADVTGTSDDVGQIRESFANHSRTARESLATDSRLIRESFAPDLDLDLDLEMDPDPDPREREGGFVQIQEPADEPPTGKAEPQGLAAPSRPQCEPDATHASPPQTAVKSQPERKSDPTPNPRRGVQRNAWNEFRPMWVEDYARMVTEAIKAPWAFPRGQTQDLADALTTHCLGEDADPFKVAGWLERNLKPFIAMATEKGPNFWSEYGPRGFLKYLNSPHLKPPEMPASMRSPEPTVASRPATPEETAQAAAAMRDLLANLTGMNPDPPREPTPIPEAWKAHQMTLVLPDKPPRRTP